MIGKKKLKRLADEIFKKSTADQTEVMFTTYTSRLTRFANNYIHQNVAEVNTSFQIRVVIGKRIGVASANTIDRRGLLRTLDYAVEIAKNQRENPDFKSLPPKQIYKKLKIFDKRTADFPPDRQASLVCSVIRLAKDSGLNGYGSFSTGASEIFITNSLGLNCYALASDVYFNTVMMGDDSSGYADGAGRRVSDVDVERIGRRAIKKALLGRRPKTLKPGRYTVILEPLASAELLDFLGWTTFGAKAIQEKRSFLVGKIGKKVVDGRVTIVEDPYGPKGLSFPFDFEGVGKKRVVLIDRGVARGYVHDTLTGGKEGKKSTGNGLPAPNPFGPIPTNLVLRTGKDSRKKMITETKRGILVTRFHYTNIIDPIKTLITGMTRDGTYLIRNGEIVGGVKNFRFTQSIIEALNRVDALGNDLTLVGHGPGYGGRHATGTLAPTIKIRGFNFSGVTRF